MEYIHETSPSRLNLKLFQVYDRIIGKLKLTFKS